VQLKGTAAGAHSTHAAVLRFDSRSSALPWLDLDEQPFALRQPGSFRVENAGFCPVLASFAAQHPALHAYGHSAGDGQAVVYFQVACHCGQAAGTNCLTHGFIQQGCDDAAVQVAGMPFECSRYRRWANHGAICGKQEFELEAAGIRRAAAEASVLRCVGQRRQFFVAYCHGFRILNAAAGLTRLVVPLPDSL
jgi:hypothetical protein